MRTGASIRIFQKLFQEGLLVPVIGLFTLAGLVLVLAHHYLLMLMQGS